MIKKIDADSYLTHKTFFLDTDYNRIIKLIVVKKVMGTREEYVWSDKFRRYDVTFFEGDTITGINDTQTL
jgi:hypothetical protein